MCCVAISPPAHSKPHVCALDDFASTPVASAARAHVRATYWSLCLARTCWGAMVVGVAICANHARACCVTDSQPCHDTLARSQHMGEVNAHAPFSHAVACAKATQQSSWRCETDTRRAARPAMHRRVFRLRPARTLPHETIIFNTISMMDFSQVQKYIISDQLRDRASPTTCTTHAARCTLYSSEYVRHSIASSSATYDSVVQEPLNHVAELKMSTTIMHSVTQCCTTSTKSEW